VRTGWSGPKYRRNRIWFFQAGIFLGQFAGAHISPRVASFSQTPSQPTMASDLSAFLNELNKPKRMQVCSLCGLQGHNRCKCPQRERCPVLPAYDSKAKKLRANPQPIVMPAPTMPVLPVNAFATPMQDLLDSWEAKAQANIVLSGAELVAHMSGSCKCHPKRSDANGDEWDTQWIEVSAAMIAISNAAQEERKRIEELHALLNAACQESVGVLPRIAVSNEPVVMDSKDPLPPISPASTVLEEQVYMEPEHPELPLPELPIPSSLWFYDTL